MRTLGRWRAAARLEPCLTFGRGVRRDAEPFQRSLAAPCARFVARLGKATAASREAATVRSATVPVRLGYVVTSPSRRAANADR